MGTLLKRSTTFHPQTDGQTTRINCYLETYLHYFCNKQPTKWNKYIPWAELWNNTTFHIASKKSLFLSVFKRPPPPLVSYGSKFTNNSAEQILMDRDLVIQALKENLTGPKSNEEASLRWVMKFS